uniref:Amine oxidase domain-containing protein n=1 Tax=Romanomermis culicivorax TaxID=13658 RepID=A0A915HQ17_ROMCU
MKVFLLFDRVFWPAEKSAFFYESQNPAGFPIYVGNIFYINRSPALLAMISGDGVHLAEKMTKEQIVEKILQSLTKMFGGEKIATSKVVYSAVINWGEQEHIYGAYSFSQIGMKSEDAYNICKPISPLLYFAGEHTAFLEDLHGSATGAYRKTGFLALKVALKRVTTENYISKQRFKL